MSAASAKKEPQRTARLPLLLEIGSDDIPARFQPPALAHLERECRAALAAARLEHGALRALATPRRLALSVADLAARQPDAVSEVKGPPVAAAYDAEGNPTAAALGFARRCGVDVADCHIVEEPRGRFLAARKVLPGRPAEEVLASVLPPLILGLPFPKVMRWGDGDLEYARPLQWVVALLGSAVVPLRLGALEAGRSSRGHRTLDGDRPFTLESAEHYEAELARHGVIVDPEERRRRIVAGFDAAVATLPGARWLEDAELMEEVVFLCEHPTALLGSYDERFFTLPPEVIVTALRAHQRYFALARADGGLLPRFLTLRDGGEEALDTVRRGNERVLRARLADALFYWEFDQRQKPDAQAARLATVTWIEGFGSVLDKTRRLERLVQQLWERGLGGPGPVPPEAVRAAALCKSDLVSEMIKDGKEFTRLEGTIGAHYARQAGESEAVARAIERHYLPRGASDELPGDPISSVLSAADRLDTLAGCWLAGFVPTGAKDPYALRRHALALLRIVLGLSAHVSLRELIGLALAPYAGLAGDAKLETAAIEVADFVRTRLEGHLEALDCLPETVKAALPAHGDDPVDALAWAQALAGFRGRPDFGLLATGFKRCKNILEGRILSGEDLTGCPDRWLRGGATPDGRSLEDLPEAAEQELRREVAAAAKRLATAEAGGDRIAILQTLSGFGPAIDKFFDSVRVNVDDEELRALRHGFLREIHGLFARYADFSEMAPPDA